MKIIISGGGTGGHVFPAIAIANAIKAIEPNADILFVGANGKIEMEKVPKAGFPIKGLWISGFHRQLTLRNLMFPLKLIASLFKARRIVKAFKPDVAVGVGGYASGPTLEMAARAGVPALIQEQNSYAGVTNKLLAKKVKKVCVAYNNMDRFFEKEKIILTGNPVREAITQIEGKKTEALEYFSFHDKKHTILVIGGSLGARTLNNAMEANFDNIANRQDVQYLWQCGKLYYEEFKEGKTAQLPNVVLTKFVDKMDLAYAVADVVISRAGATSISELCLVQKPVILVPSPNVAEDHQTKNAMALVAKNAAILVKDSDAKDNMVTTALAVLGDHAHQLQLSQNIKTLGRRNAAERIAKEVLKLVK
ncbi:MAG: UDP-N-acetylglucosamine--N-acetylmuramyl-(pentapeptide) pyrophosphoryl-undecaprenol N-acetylglucosamine transferase [Cognaticolwellia sp.]|jgi:UDP-N-acetylglucosamine--N-acetylmuramyl-(pentapeptide) pyrophosphoryl-undecaprenol N-acetylglucosamine transferase